MAEQGSGAELVNGAEQSGRTMKPWGQVIEEGDGERFMYAWLLHIHACI